MQLFDYFLEYGKKVSYSKNDVIFNENDLCERIGYLVSGNILITTYTLQEQEVIINSLHNHDIFGDMLIFSSSPYYYGMAIANTNVVVYYLSKDSLLKLFKEENNFLNLYLTTISNKGVLLKQQNKLLAHKNIEERIIYYLSSTKQKDNTVYYKSVKNIADILSLPRPSVSRSLHKLEKEGIIKIKPHIIELANM